MPHEQLGAQIALPMFIFMGPPAGTFRFAETLDGETLLILFGRFRGGPWSGRQFNFGILFAASTGIVWCVGGVPGHAVYASELEQKYSPPSPSGIVASSNLGDFDSACIMLIIMAINLSLSSSELIYGGAHSRGYYSAPLYIVYVTFRHIF